MQTYWNMNPNCTWDLSENFNCMNQIASIGGVSGTCINKCVLFFDYFCFFGALLSVIMYNPCWNARPMFCSTYMQRMMVFHLQTCIHYHPMLKLYIIFDKECSTRLLLMLSCFWNYCNGFILILIFIINYCSWTHKRISDERDDQWGRTHFCRYENTRRDSLSPWSSRFFFIFLQRVLG